MALTDPAEIITGETTERDAFPPPPSVRRLQQHNPKEKLAMLHNDRLLAEDELKRVLVEYNLVVNAGDVRATAGVF